MAGDIWPLFTTGTDYVKITFPMKLSDFNIVPVCLESCCHLPANIYT